MEKSIYSDDYRRLCRRLRELRVDAGLSQHDVAERLTTSQSFVTKYETGERRLDLIQLREVCRVLGVRLSVLAAEFDD